MEPSGGGSNSYIQTMWLQNPLTLFTLYPAIGFSAVDQPRPAGLEGRLLQQQQQRVRFSLVCDDATGGF